MKKKIMPFQRFYDSRYGWINITRDMAEKMAENFKNKIPHYVPHINLRHNKERYGDITGLEVKSDGLYADIEYTPEGLKLVREEKYRYFSPEYLDDYVDKRTGKSCGPAIVGLALTNQPAQPDTDETFRFEEHEIKTLTIKLEEEEDEMPDGNDKVIKLYEEELANVKNEKKKLEEKLGESEKKANELEKKLGESEKSVKELTEKISQYDTANKKIKIDSWKKKMLGEKNLPKSLVEIWEKKLEEAEDVDKEIKFAEETLKNIPGLKTGRKIGLDEEDTGGKPDGEKLLEERVNAALGFVGMKRGEK